MLYTAYIQRSTKAQCTMSNKWLSPKNRNKVEIRDMMTCCYCSKLCCKYNDRINQLDYATIDHIVPRSEIYATCTTLDEYKREIQNPRNLVLVCNACNSSKQATPLFIWCATKGYDYAVILAEIACRINMGV